MGILSLLGANPAKTQEVPLNSATPYTDLRSLENNEIVHISTGVKVNLDQMIDVVSESRVIYIGETHDNLEAHRAQLEVIQKLTAIYPGQVAVGMEMFRRSAQTDLNRWQRGELSDRDFRILFRKNWGAGYSTYQPIFKYLKSQSIPLLGLKSSRETEALFKNAGANAEPGIFPEMDETDIHHKAHSMAIFGGHQDHSKALEKPYQMLVLWEESMAQTVAEFLQNESYRGWKLVVLAGGFHVQYGFGIPKRAFRRTPHSYSIILPTVTEIPEELKDREMDVPYVPIPLPSADFAWKLEYKIAGKDRVRLGVMLSRENGGEEIRITSVSPNSIAQKAGIRDGDIFLRMDGESLENVDELIDRLQMKKYGDTVSIGLLRGTEEIVLMVPLTKEEIKN